MNAATTRIQVPILAGELPTGFMVLAHRVGYRRTPMCDNTPPQYAIVGHDTNGDPVGIHKHDYGPNPIHPLEADDLDSLATYSYDTAHKVAMHEGNGENELRPVPINLVRALVGVDS